MSQLVDNDDCHLFLYQNNTHELDCHCHEAAKYIVYNPKKNLIVFMTMNSTREEDKKGQRKGIKFEPQHLKILRDNLDYCVIRSCCIIVLFANQLTSFPFFILFSKKLTSRLNIISSFYRAQSKCFQFKTIMSKVIQFKEELKALKFKKSYQVLANQP
ncbi:hypothetical protein BD560DRAFT_429213 [Blakeslea trispora]|nr:hypothetical protein BD560DRAFT_429213 [Blakeslea trispora]